MSEKRYTFQHVVIQPAENGYVVSGQAFDTSLTFVAKTTDEVTELLRRFDITITARGLDGYAGKLASQAEALTRVGRMRQPTPYPDAPTERPDSADMATGTSADRIAGR